MKLITKITMILFLFTSLSACNAITRLSELDSGPKVTPISNPVGRPKYRPVSMPMPSPKSVLHKANSLWRPGARKFFRDQRAGQVGDILTVKL